jgi:hypothetical protein
MDEGDNRRIHIHLKETKCSKNRFLAVGALKLVSRELFLLTLRKLYESSHNKYDCCSSLLGWLIGLEWYGALPTHLLTRCLAAMVVLDRYMRCSFVCLPLATA